MNEYTVEEREELIDTLNAKDDTLRLIYRINTGEDNKFERELYDICEAIIREEDKAGVDYKAITFLFWEDGMPVGQVAALASLTYAPAGIWESAMELSGEIEPMKLVVDFNRYAE